MFFNRVTAGSLKTKKIDLNPGLGRSLILFLPKLVFNKKNKVEE